MKKLAIMFVMLLGSVATMQAQSFSFSCNSAGAENITLSVTAELSNPQIVSAIAGGYSVAGDAGEEILERRTGAGEQFYLQFGSFYYGGVSGFEFGPVAYRVFAQYVDANNVGGLSYHDNAADAFAALGVSQLSDQEVEVINYNTNNPDTQTGNYDEGSLDYNIGDFNYTIEYLDGNWEAQDGDGELPVIIAGSLENVIIAIIDRHSN